MRTGHSTALRIFRLSTLSKLRNGGVVPASSTNTRSPVASSRSSMPRLTGWPSGMRAPRRVRTARISSRPSSMRTTPRLTRTRRLEQLDQRVAQAVGQLARVGEDLGGALERDQRAVLAAQARAHAPQPLHLEQRLEMTRGRARQLEQLLRGGELVEAARAEVAGEQHAEVLAGLLGRRQRQAQERAQRMRGRAHQLAEVRRAIGVGAQQDLAGAQRALGDAERPLEPRAVERLVLGRADAAQQVLPVVGLHAREPERHVGDLEHGFHRAIEQRVGRGALREREHVLQQHVAGRSDHRRGDVAAAAQPARSGASPRGSRDRAGSRA
jgi:hypothetical protein